MAPPDRPRLVAGTSAGERRPAIRRGPEHDWYLPAHARDPNAVRRRQAAQVAAGADVIVAQTYLTHRRALARVGETRRARELTAAAVTLARSAIDEGLASRGSDETGPMQVLIAGALPPPDDEPETATGRLLPRDAAIEHDLEAHAGVLAESGVDLIVVEGGSMAQAVAGAAAVRAVGLPAWVVIDAHQPGTREELLPFDPAAYLVSGRPGPDDLAAVVRSGLVVGVWLTTPPDPESLASLTEAWLAAGASAIALADDATPERLASAAAAIDAFCGAAQLGRAEAEEQWREWVRAGARVAPPGRAIWLSDAGLAQTVPEGWAWDVAKLKEARRLPAARFCLAVVSHPAIDPDVGTLARSLEPGGVLVFAASETAGLPEGIRVIEQRDEGGRRWLIGRREDRRVSGDHR